ncbi:MAG: hypothetical protein AB1597_05790 [Chloroflexota bacterium]
MKHILAVVLVALMVMTLMPALPAAAKDPVKVTFNEILIVQGIGPGIVQQVGNPEGTYYWKVSERPVFGAVKSGNVFSTGVFQFIYSGLIAPDQSGRVVGDLTIANASGTATAKLTSSMAAPIQVGYTLNYSSVWEGGTVYPLCFVARASFASGQFAFVSGTGSYLGLRGNGTFTGDVFIIISIDDWTNLTGHVVGIADGTTPVWEGFPPPSTPPAFPASLAVMSGQGILG